MDSKIKVAVIGPGNIGTDLMYKIRRSRYMDLVLMTGIKPDSEGLALASSLGIPTSLTGIDAILENDEVQIVLNGTSIGYANRTRNDSWSGELSINLPDSLVNNTGQNIVEFQNTYNPPNTYWRGVGNVSVE